MKAVVRALCATVLLAGALGAGAPPSRAATAIAARVVGVIDGDTIDVITPDRQQLRIRLAEIDAPEHDQPWGQRSKQALSALVFSRSVTVAPIGTDRYGRTIAHLYVERVDVNREMVRRGAAWAYRQYLHDQGLLAVEQSARVARVGLWSMPARDVVPPWEWRHPNGPRAVAAASWRANSGYPAMVTVRAPSGAVACGSKRYCRQMASCEEATAYLRQCGASQLDGDHDGIPCEALCGHGR